MCLSSTRPAFIPAPNTARVVMRYTQFGQEIENVFMFDKGSPYDAASLAALNASIATEWNANLKALQTHQVVLDFIQSTALDAPIAPQETLAVGVVGGHADNGLPTGVTIAVKYASGMTGRSSNGRMYWIGLPFTQFTLDQVNAGYLGSVVAGIAAFFANVAATTSAIHVITSYCNAKAWRTTAVNTPVVSYLTTDANIDSQRRRLAGRGI